MRALFLSLLFNLACWAQPPQSVSWEAVGGSPTPAPARTPSARERRNWEQYKQFQQRAQAPAAPARRPAPPPPEPSPFSGVLTALAIVVGGMAGFWLLFRFVHMAGGMGSGQYKPHKVDVGPIDRERANRFANTPSPPPLDLGVSNSYEDPGYDSNYSYGGD